MSKTSATATVVSLEGAKAQPKIDVPESKLSAVRQASFVGARQGESMTAVLLAAGGDLPQVRLAYIVGYVAARLDEKCATLSATLTDRATNIVSGIGYAAKSAVKPGQIRRTEAQDNLCGQARDSWSHALRKAGLKAVGKQGGKGGKRGAQTPTGDSDATQPRMQVAPAHANSNDVAMFIHQQAAMLSAYALKNAKYMGIDYRNAVAAFVTAVKAIKLEEDDGDAD
jgi:hypothetical protein